MSGATKNKGKSKRKKDIIHGRVKELRTSSNVKLTQEEFAWEIGCSTNTISRIEQRKISLTSDIALKIAEKFDVSLDWLFMLTDDDNDFYAPKKRKKLQDVLNYISESDNDSHSKTPKIIYTPRE
ncbi:MAG: helix-turn-helix transcriptional regulator [Oscillospiraceae bacterium]|nr:helix-turn-helix transcriptional regulator [Oscillospiraceae bacterium]